MQEFASPKNPLFGRPRFHLYKTRHQCAHGPSKWPWWKWISFSVSHMAVCLPSTGRALWIYTRWGAIAIDMVIDRRAMLSPKGRGW